jgi:carbon-monoxide dehydrogenase small subunit
LKEIKQIRVTINGILYSLEVEANLSLLDMLRDRLNLTGTKKGCEEGACGTCTVILDGLAIVSCLTLAPEVDGSSITTIEGLAKGDVLHPLQKAFIEVDALQCGFCTPGQILSAKALLDTNSNPTEEEIKEALSGNLCRCGCYNRIVEAVMSAAKHHQR